MNREITYMLAVVKYGGITRAAEKLFITPSALSKYVHTKETELDITIFNRIGKSFQLTYAGQRYIDYLKKDQELRKKMRLELRQIQQQSGGQINIGFQNAEAEFLITSIIPRFMKEFPNARISLKENATKKLVPLLQKNELDCVITAGINSNQDVQERIIRTGETVIVAPAADPLFTKPVEKPEFHHPWLPFSEIHRHEIIASRRDDYFRKFLDNYLVNEKSEDQPFSIDVTSTHTMLMGVLNGLGWAMTLDTFVKNSDLQGLKMYSLGEKPNNINLKFLTMDNINKSPELTMLNKICMEEFK